jgi:uncharacterized protein (DUF58 family)
MKNPDPLEHPAAWHRVHTRITRNGIHMAFVAVFAMLGGSIRGLNLLVILAGLMIGILLMQWRFCRATIPGLSVRRTLPVEAHAGAPFKVRFSVTNHRSWLPAWLIRLEDRILGGSLSSKGNGAVCSVGVVRPSCSEPVHYDCLITTRGRYSFGPVRLATGFPFGLLDAWRNTQTQTELVVYPSMPKLTPRWSGLIENRREGLAASRHSAGPNDGEFFGIRAWRNGDNQRWIHWRTTARVGELSVRQFEQRNRTQLSLLLDPYLDKSTDDRQNEQDLEWAISVTAAIASELSSSNSNRMAFGVADGQSNCLFSNRVTDFRRATLETLAMVKGCEQTTLSETLAQLLVDGNPSWPVLIVSPRSSRLDLLRSDPKPRTASITPALLSRMDLIWLDVTSVAGGQIAVRDGVGNGTH